MLFKMVTAIIRNEAFEEVENELRRMGIHGMTVTPVKGFGEGANYLSQSWLMESKKLEIIIEEDKVEKLVDAIMGGAHSGADGDGVVAVSSLEKLYRIRTQSEIDHLRDYSFQGHGSENALNVEP